MNLSDSPLVLVTGATGWLGLGLVNALAHGLPDHPALAEPFRGRIRCFVAPGEKTEALRRVAPNAEIVEGDVRNAADCRKLCQDASGAILFHTAGIIHPRNVRQFYEVNRDGTKNMLDAAVAGGVKRAVIVSSNSPCGCNPHSDHLFDEQSPYHPYMNYGRSKMLMEQLVQDIQRTGRIETVVIRPPWFYGPFQPPRQTLFFTMIQEGKGPIVGSGNNLRSMAYIDNLCQGLMLAALTPKASGQTYWIADEKPYTMNQVIDTVERLLETEFNKPCAHKRLRLPGVASEVALAVDWTLQSLGLYHQKIHVLSEMNKTIACSVQKAKDELTYAPRVSLEEGMRRSLRWCVEQRLL